MTEEQIPTVERALSTNWIPDLGDLFANCFDALPKVSFQKPIVHFVAGFEPMSFTNINAAYARHCAKALLLMVVQHDAVLEKRPYVFDAANKWFKDDFHCSIATFVSTF
ncbi:hypothetical protein T484DRAFT_1755305 [Baffinella frigidus]|nr:hypothetical protein T484DRAFT_1755305 [Cryptophyta sp. CCMP2293]